MDKKKIILISVIIGLFLFIAIALPLSLLSSKDKTVAAAAPAVSVIPNPLEDTLPSRPATMDVRDTVVNPPASNAQNIIINNYDKGTELESKTLPNEGGGLTINVLPSSQPPAQPDQPPAALSPAPQPEITAPKTNSTSKTAPVQASKPPQQTPPPPAVKTSPPATTGKPKPAAAPASPAAKPAAVYDYWIQAGAFSSQTRAENAKKALREKGILSSTVENVTVNGQDFFRVRIGPYTSRDEAAYWLKLIKVMDSLNESYITQTPRP